MSRVFFGEFLIWLIIDVYISGPESGIVGARCLWMRAIVKVCDLLEMNFAPGQVYLGQALVHGSYRIVGFLPNLTRGGRPGEAWE